MRKLSTRLAAACLAGMVMVSVAHAQWYAGGTLHQGNGLEWRYADEDDRLATAADFVATIYGADRVKRLGGLNKIKPDAIRLMVCIDEATRGGSADSLRVTEVASTCWLLINQ